MSHSRMRTIITNLNSRARLEVAAGKAVRRFEWARLRRQGRRATAWASGRSIDWDDSARSIDEGLWGEATTFGRSLADEAERILETQAAPLGGGGAYPLLYFLVRMLKPSVVVETGVAAGWTTRAVLEAQERNGLGELWSSDFPYLKNPHPEQAIGCLVPERLKQRWYLELEGDRRNLPRILERCGSVDLFHYDSDKSYRGRAWALQAVLPHVHESSLIVMDDIQDNMLFADFVRNTGYEHVVFAFDGKYVGMTAHPNAPWQQLKTWHRRQEGIV